MAAASPSLRGQGNLRGCGWRRVRRPLDDVEDVSDTVRVWVASIGCFSMRISCHVSFLSLFRRSRSLEVFTGPEADGRNASRYQTCVIEENHSG